jgi:exonuclease SbcC
VIKNLELKDFISHKDTKLEFGRGITVFVGHNGSGKSSVIDAITYALFGEHTRKANKNLVRRGCQGQAMVQMRFTINSKEFQATRSLAPSGSAAFSQLELLSENGTTVNKKLAGGERKQYGESTSAEVAKVLGLDYKKLRVAAVVQQGELVSIVEAQPKEFKELVNGLIGIDRLDLAFSTMKDVISGFRDKLRDETGYNDEDIPRVQQLVADKEKELAQTESVLKEFEDEKALLDGKIAGLEREMERLEPMIAQSRELATREELLLRHVREKKTQLETEAGKMERTIAEAGDALVLVGGRDETQMRLKMVGAELEEIQGKMVENEGDAGRLRGFLECAGKLQVREGRCPVCGSEVERVDSMFDTSHIQKEISKKEKERSKLQMGKVELTREQKQLAELDRRIASAEKFLADNSIGSAGDVENLKQHLVEMKTGLAKLPRTIARVDDPASLAIDDQSIALATEIALLREKVKGFSQSSYTNAKLEKGALVQKLQEANRRMGNHQRAIDDARKTIDSAKAALARLAQASEFVGMLERIRSYVYNRDGTVGMSLRSWALATVSKKASEYASLFNIGISRVELAEKARDIVITCYGKSGEVDMDSLSGGEKVAVALAIRLAIAYMMGSSKLDFVILDEPTTHLDEERRKALVRIISDAFREGAGPLAQLVIITHDAEIFEDSEVDAVFRFSMTSDGSQVLRE